MLTLLKGFWSKYQFRSKFEPGQKGQEWSLNALKFSLRDGKDATTSFFVDTRALVTFLLIPVVYVFAGESGNQWLYLLAAALISALMLGLIIPFLQVMDVSTSYALPLSAMARDSVELKITIYRKWLLGPVSRLMPIKWLLVRAVLRHSTGKSNVLRPMALEFVGSEAWVYAATGPLTRGTYKLEGIEVYSCFPFGLFWWSRNFEAKTKGTEENPLLTVFPQIVAVEGNLLYRIRSATDSPMGLIASRTAKAAMSSSVRGVREFVHGDSPRLIHWSSSARVGKLLAREFEAEGLPGFDLLINLRANWISKEQFELAISVAHSLLHLGFRLGGNPEFMIIPNLDGDSRFLPAFMEDMPNLPPGLGRSSQLLARVEPLRSGKTKPGQIANLGFAMHQALLTVRPAGSAGEDKPKLSDAVELAVIPRTWEAASGAVEEVHMPVHDQGIVNRRSARGKSSGRVLSTIEHLDQVTTL